MKWQSNLIGRLEWSEDISNKEGKLELARLLSEKVNDGDVIGAGSGSTSYLALLAIAKKAKEQSLHVKMIPTSLEITMACIKLGLQVTSLLEDRPNWSFDGADEVDPQHSLIKGRGGALFKEKLLILSSPKNYILVDHSKLVDRLGSNFPVPIEVFPGALTYVESALKTLGIEKLALRQAKGKDGPILTENGNLILDAWFEHIPAEMEQSIKKITGVIESGLFMGCNIDVMTAQ